MVPTIVADILYFTAGCGFYEVTFEDKGGAETLKVYDCPVSETELLSRITIDPDLCHGKPCIRGLRYPVETLLETSGKWDVF